uniref:NADPH oxidase activator 1 n=1 Tax=Latimeria chalumnae TaxID=7897 RepID=H3AUC7_LATCH
MPYKDLLQGWHEGVLAIDRKEWESALEILSGIQEPTSRICFTKGCVYLLLGKLNEAIKEFDRTIAKDERLAVGFFQRGVAHLRAEKYQEALSDCKHAEINLRGNAVIDYRQLGLRFKLHKWEVVLHNKAVVLCHSGQWGEAAETLQEASQLKEDGRVTTLDAAQNNIKQHILFEPLEVPAGEVFRPRKQEIEQLNLKDFLGKPKVISSVIPDDDFTGFEPLRPQKPGYYEPKGDRTQCSNKGYHKVLFNIFPNNSSELEVKEGNVVFVLEKGDDGWAVVIHDGQKSYLPGFFLQKATNTPKGIPLPPSTRPPNRPQKSEGMKVLHSVKATTRTPENKPAKGSSNFPPIKTSPFCLEPLFSFSVIRLSSCKVREEKNRGVIFKEVMLFLSTGSSPVSPVTDSAPSFKESPVAHEEQPSNTDNSVITKIHFSFSIAARVNPGISLMDLQALIQQKFAYRAGQLQETLCYKDTENQELVPVQRDEDLMKMWEQVPHKDRRVTLWCKDINPFAGRTVLYQMVAIYDYTSQGPEDLEFNKGDIIDILSEVNEEWLEGRCSGNIGIFPQCYAIQNIEAT